MFNLILNENMKIYRKVSTWIMIALIIVAVILFGVILKIEDKQNIEEPDWKVSLQQQNAQLEKDIAEGYMPEQFVQMQERTILINEYRLENETPPMTKSVWSFTLEATPVIALITLFTIIVGASSVASEFSWGTIKLLLIRPVSRTKILLSKYLSTILFALFCLLILFVISLAVGAILFGFDGFAQPYLTVIDGVVVEKTMLAHVLGQYGLSSINLIMMSTFAFMISSIFRSSALSIGLAIFLMFTGVNVTSFIAMKFDWAKYILFANTDLSLYLEGMPVVEGMTMSFSITMLIIYFVVFNALSWWMFNKRDVAA
ncbi:ABC transporter permease [Litchfieldia salsa]|uniref:ABC-2 type transport system permease protein n=1 Tax=Litchfieldia salsa TaxID=930152 RepID=A0A1H0V6E8_9BACI|nr:ABC transporter permease [Litchfieldia salsa]SDP73987.1 ABC-2 type transport system permease protein [Litchfieldia salsa]